MASVRESNTIFLAPARGLQESHGAGGGLWKCASSACALDVKRQQSCRPSKPASGKPGFSGACVRAPLGIRSIALPAAWLFAESLSSHESGNAHIFRGVCLSAFPAALERLTAITPPPGFAGEYLLEV